MSEDAPRPAGAPAPAGARTAAIAASAAHVRDLERRAFARPSSRAGAADAAAAAAELARLRAVEDERAPDRVVAPDLLASADRVGGADRLGGADRAPVVQRPALDGSGDGRNDAVADDIAGHVADLPPTLGERAAAIARATGAALHARARRLTRRDIRRLGASALALGLVAAAGGTVHAALTAPPPAYAVFAEEVPEGDRVSLISGDSIAWESELEQRGTIVLEGPHLFGERDDMLRVGVYREWLDADRTEVCAGLVVDNAWSFRTTCTSEAEFRRSGLVSTFDQEGVRIEYGWMPDGEVLLETEQTGVQTLEELRALDLPAVAAIESAGLDLGIAREVLPWAPDVLAGPLELGEFDRWRFFALIVEIEAAPWESAPRPQLCLAARDDRTRADGNGIVVGCAPAERFQEDGLSVQTDDGVVAQWDAQNVFDAELP
ncbi:hypothetical protein [Yonghaparkia sp. Root332]|uniref:hypothetical protein n=1 Tax=Yonghaparkia sp. Root332 TaxID=1736516 RepID=UPI000701ECAA|nr:hypothetical protein [Yonghaparkia sp. Root332]KQV25236.1 hypothetical protein ASC54_12425 [Yonghaparkia sp. Root332]